LGNLKEFFDAGTGKEAENPAESRSREQRIEKFTHFRTRDNKGFLSKKRSFIGEYRQKHMLVFSSSPLHCA